MLHFIVLELHGIRMPDETAKLHTELREMGECYAFQKLAWFVESELTNDEICKKLARHLKVNDRMMVTRIYRDWASANVPQEEADWLSARNFAGKNDHILAQQFPRV